MAQEYHRIASTAQMDMLMANNVPMPT